MDVDVEGPASGPGWHGRDNLHVASVPHSTQDYALAYEAPELAEAPYEPDVAQVHVTHAGAEAPRNARWSSASLDEAPDTRSAGSFASWGRPAGQGPPYVAGAPTSRSGSASGPGSGFGLGSPVVPLGGAGGVGALCLGSPGVSGRGGTGSGVSVSPRSKLATVVSEDCAGEDRSGDGGGGGDGEDGAAVELDPTAGPAGDGDAEGAYSVDAHGAGAYDAEVYGRYDPAVAAAHDAAGHPAAFGSVAHYHDSFPQIGCADDGGGGGTADPAAGGGWPADPQSALEMLAEQRQQYRSWVGQCAATALAALTPPSEYGGGGGAVGGADVTFPAGSIPADVPGMVAAMDAAGCVREHLLLVKAASEAVREAARAAAAFAALALPEPEVYDSADAVSASEAAEAEYVSAAYGVTTAVAAGVAAVEALEQPPGAGAALLQEILPDAAGAVSGDAAAGGVAGGPAGALRRRLRKIGAELCGTLREEAAGLLARLHWPPPLADMGSTAAAAPAAAAPAAEAAAAEGVGADGLLQTASSVAGAPGSSAAGAGPAFSGFETRPVLARRLVGVLTALTHFQMAVGQRPAFIALLTGQPTGTEGAEDGDGGAEAAKPLLWATQVLAEPVAAKLRAHFHPAAPTGRLDRPAWLYGTALDFVRQYGHSLSTLDDMLACLNLKPHYNMPAEFARALQEAVLELVRKERIPAMLALRNQRPDGTVSEPAAEAAGSAEAAEAEALWLSLMDASAAYDIALLPLLGATGPAAEAEAARAAGLLAAAAAGGPSRRRACDLLDPTAAGTADMHSRYVAVALAAPPPRQPADAAADGEEQGAEADAAAHWGLVASGAGRPGAAAAPPAPLLAAWAAAEAAAALRVVEAAAYDESSLAPAEEAAARALGAGSGEDDEATGAADGGAGGGLRRRGGAARAGAGAAPPWSRDTWPPLLAAEAAAQLDGLVARSRWLSAAPGAQKAFLEAAGGPALALLRRRLARLVDGAVARGDALSEEGLPKVCAALCAAHALHEHLHSLLLTQLAPLVAALGAAAAADAAADVDASGAATPASSAVADSLLAGKLGGGGGFWSGLLAAAGGSASRGGGSAAGTASPARLALRDGVTALAVGGGAGAASLASVAAAAAGAGGAGGVAAPVLGEHVRGFARLHRDGCLKLAREVALGFGRCSVAYRHAIEANPQFPFTPEGEAEGAAGGEAEGPASSITSSFAPALLFLQNTLARLSRCCDKATFADVWRGAALSINRFMFNFIATESRFTRQGARQFAADVAGLASLFAPYSRRAVASASASSASLAGAATAAAAAGGQHFRELQAAARLLCCSDDEAADIMRRASAAAVAAAAGTANGATPQKARAGGAGRPPLPPIASPFSSPTKGAAAAAAGGGGPAPHARGDPVRGGMAADPVLSSAGFACLSPLQIMNVIEHRI